VFEHDTTKGVLRSENHLTSDFRPKKPVGREEEIQGIVGAVRPLTRRKEPDNLLVHGPAGVGKTTCVRHVFDQLGEETAVKAIYINCWQYDSRSSLLTQLLIELGYPVPRKGRPVDQLLSRITEFVGKSDGVAVALDEFDKLGDQTEVVYDLQYVSEEADQHLGMVPVSNQGPDRVNLDPRSESRLRCQEFLFEPYSAGEIVDILSDRVEQAFRPGSISDDIIRRIAEGVAENSGDCREALRQLLNLGRRADRNGIDELTAETVTELV